MITLQARGRAALGPDPELLAWLREHAIEFALDEHPLAIAARETARAGGVEPRAFAKTVIVETGDGRRALVVLAATARLDLRKAARVLDARDVRLMGADELRRSYPECRAEAPSPIGALYRLPVVADFTIRDDETITFRAGCHTHSVRVDRAAWEAAVVARYADLAAGADTRCLLPGG